MIEENYTTYGSPDENSYITLGNIRAPVENHYSDKKNIYYQLEPLKAFSKDKIESIVQNISTADEVWDYDLENIQILESYGLRAKFKPMRYASSLVINKEAEPEIDILFYGSFTQKRFDFIKYYFDYLPLQQGEYTDQYANCNFVWVYNSSDERLDDLIAKSKIVINLNPFQENNIQQQTRIYYALINNKCVVSERSNINYFKDSILQFSNEMELKHLIDYLLVDDNWKKYPKKTSSFFYGSTDKIALFSYSETPNIELLSSFCDSLAYDRVEYSHFAYEHSIQYSKLVHKINRLTDTYSRQKFINDVMTFSRCNPDYALLVMTNSNVNIQETLEQHYASLDQGHVQVSPGCLFARAEYINRLNDNFEVS